MSKRSTVVGFAAVVLLMSAGAAQSLSGSNTVFSDDIVDGTITHADVKANSLGGSRFLDNSVTGAKILNSTVTSADLAKGGVTGADAEEAGTKNLDFLTINPGTCAWQNVVEHEYHPEFGGGKNWDVAYVSTSSGWPDGLSVHTEVDYAVPYPMVIDYVAVVACNVSNTAINPPSTAFKYVVMSL